MFSEQKRLMSLIPQWDPRHRTGVNPLAVLLLENRLFINYVMQVGEGGGESLCYNLITYYKSSSLLAYGGGKGGVEFG